MSTTKKWVIDSAHSEIDFKVKHLMISNVKGSFKKIDATVHTTGNDFTSAEIDVWIDPSSIDTANTQRDEHLKSADFLDIENHKQITFTGNTLRRTEKKDTYELLGDLTIKGISKSIKLDVEYGGMVLDPLGVRKVGFSVHGVIDRKDWGLNWNTLLEAGGVMVSDEVRISCEVQFKEITQENKSMAMDTEAENKEKITEVTFVQ